MTSTSTIPPGERLISLDAFRGITIAGMILVNNPGSWTYVYRPLRHAEWHGWTPTDLVFPFFMFIVGVAMTFSFRRRLAQGGGRGMLFAQVVRRTIILFALGLVLASFPDLRLIDKVRAGTAHPPLVVTCLSVFRLAAPYILVIAGVALFYADQPLFGLRTGRAALIRKGIALVLIASAAAYFAIDFGYFQETRLRVPGVLQRIAVCYLFASLIVRWCNVWGQAAVGALLLIAYWLIVTGVHPPAGFEAKVRGPEGLLHEWLDVHVFGRHVYSDRPDPEGILSTLPAIVTILAGALAGHWLQSGRERIDKVIGLFLAANVILVLGLWIGYVFPINKKIWTSSYVLATAGVALHFLAVCYWLIDVKGYRRWAWPFVIFGSNAIVAYVAGGLVAKTLAMVKLADGRTSVKGSLFDRLLEIWPSPLNVSLAYPLLYLAILLIPMYLLYRKRIFVRI